MAHNEAGLEALLEVARGLTAPGARAPRRRRDGDRPDDAIEAIGEIAGKGADHVVIAHKPKYRRGCSIEDIDKHLRAGLARVGIGEVESYGIEPEGFVAVVPTLADGDVLAFMCHDSQPTLQSWLAEHGGTVDDPGPSGGRSSRVASTSLESEIAELWSMTDDAARLAAADQLVTEAPGDPACLRAGGRLRRGRRRRPGDRAAEGALAGGLREPYRHRAQIQVASTLQPRRPPARPAAAGRGRGDAPGKRRRGGVPCPRPRRRRTLE